MVMNRKHVPGCDDCCGPPGCGCDGLRRWTKGGTLTISNMPNPQRWEYDYEQHKVLYDGGNCTQSSVVHNQLREIDWTPFNGIHSLSLYRYVWQNPPSLPYYTLETDTDIIDAAENGPVDDDFCTFFGGTTNYNYVWGLYLVEDIDVDYTTTNTYTGAGEAFWGGTYGAAGTTNADYTMTNIPWGHSQLQNGVNDWTATEIPPTGASYWPFGTPGPTTSNGEATSYSGTGTNPEETAKTDCTPSYLRSTFGYLIPVLKCYPSGTADTCYQDEAWQHDQDDIDDEDSSTPAGDGRCAAGTESIYEATFWGQFSYNADLDLDYEDLT